MVYEAKIIDILSDSCPTHIILTGQVLRILDQDSFILGDDSGSVHVDHMDFYHESKSYIVAKKYEATLLQRNMSNWLIQRW